MPFKPTHELRLGQDLPSHRRFQFCPIGSRAQAESLLIQRVHFKEVAVRSVSLWGTRSAVAEFSKIVFTAYAHAARFHPLREIMDSRRDVVKEPVIPGSRGRIGIIHDQGETARAGGLTYPLQGRRDIRPLAREQIRNPSAFREGAR